MADCYITEYDNSGNSHILPVVSLDALVTTQKVSYTTATQSSAFNANTAYIEVYLDSAAHIAYGTNPTATASSSKFPAGQRMQFRVSPSNKISIYDGSS